jgi:Outer membrane protein/protective antigen OMA87
MYIKYIYRGKQKTKANIILRELPFKVGSIMSSEQLSTCITRAHENLTNTSLFNYINIFPEEDTTIANEPIYPNQEVIVENYSIKIIVEERWYFWPVCNIKLEERNINSWIHKGDLNRITYDLGLTIYNVTGRNHKLGIRGSFGFEKGFNLSYNNILLGNSGKHLMGLKAYSLFNKTLNVYSLDNKPIYIKSSNGFLYKNHGGNISYTYRQTIRTSHSAIFGYDKSIIKDTVLKINPRYWGIKGRRSHTFTLTYRLNIEGRDYNVYPTKGYYVNAECLFGNVNDFDFICWKLKLSTQYYFQLSERWFWGSALKFAATLKNKEAYIYDRALGYDNVNMTGYDLYVADGQYYSIVNNNIKFLIMPKKVFTLNFLRCLSKFYKIHFTIYGKLNLDAGYVHNKYNSIGNKMENKMLIGSGIGIDVVSYYDTVISISYAINKFGEHGFYFGITAPII